MQKLYEDLKDYGLGILAVNSNDDRVTVEKYVRENRYSFLIGLSNASGPGGQVPVSFKVDSYPTNYLLDANGTIIYRSRGFDEAGLRKVLASLGVKRK